MTWRFEDTAFYAIFATLEGLDYLIVGGMFGLYIALLVFAFTSAND